MFIIGAGKSGSREEIAKSLERDALFGNYTEFMANELRHLAFQGFETSFRHPIQIERVYINRRAFFQILGLEVIQEAGEGKWVGIGSSRRLNFVGFRFLLSIQDALSMIWRRTGHGRPSIGPLYPTYDRQGRGLFVATSWGGQRIVGWVEPTIIVKDHFRRLVWENQTGR